MSCYAAALRVSGDRGREVEAAEGVWGEEGGDLADLRAAQGEHVDGVRHEGLRLVVPGVGKEGDLPVRANGMRRQRVAPASGPPLRKIATCSRPRYQVGRGGIVIFASSASMATTASTSLRSQAVT
jgi:hypothetical protein